MMSVPSPDDLGLPRALTSLIGREREIAAVSALLQSRGTRLVTLTGPGGVGKTRLAQAAAAQLADTFRDGVAFVPLQSIADPTLVTSAIAQTLGVREDVSRTPLDAIVATLRRRELLLVVDNFEHLLPAAPVIADLLAACPHLSILITSRVVLHLTGEHDIRVPPLEVPDVQHLQPVECLSQVEAVRLFVERARAARSDFALTPENAPAVASICARLDGLPLAIELAATRIRMLSPAALLSLLERRLVLLTGGPRDAPVRQQTMRDTIAWSYDLLSDEQQRLLRRLAVFAGGWTLDAAQAVCSEAPSTDPAVVEAEGSGQSFNVLNALAALIDHSLVVYVEQPDGSSRYGMLETIREFAREQLDASGEANVLQARHAEYFLAMAEEASSHDDSGDQRLWHDRLEPEHDNLRAAIRWFRGRSDIDRGVRLAGALGVFWNARGYLTEGRAQIASMLALPGADAPTHARAHALVCVATIAAAQGDHETDLRAGEEALAIWESLGDRVRLPMAYVLLGIAAGNLGDYERANDVWEQAAATAQEVGDLPALARSLINRGGLATTKSDFDTAAVLLQQGLDTARAAEHPQTIRLALRGLGHLAEARGDVAEAETLARESFTRSVEDGSGWRIAEDLEAVAVTDWQQGRLLRAARLLGASESLRERYGRVVQPTERDKHERFLGELRAALGDEFNAALEKGAELSLDEAVAYALTPEPQDAAEPAAVPPPLPSLSKREMDVLRLIVDGMSDKEIAAELSISPYTVMRHVQNILNRLGLPSRTAAATYAVRHGLV